MKQLAIFASGNGSNAEAIVHYFRSTAEAEVAVILTNKADAGVRERAKRLGIPCHHFTSAEMREGVKPLSLLREQGIDLIILAGYLCLVTPPYIMEYPDRIINIHPALLPAYGGKGMYGDHVHRAVLEAREQVSGITIHLVNERYDEGRHLLQATCPVLEGDSPVTLASRIHEQEHRPLLSIFASYPRGISVTSEGASVVPLERQQ